MTILNECWEWKGWRTGGTRTCKPYGYKSIEGNTYRTHRLAWAWANWSGEGDWEDAVKTLPEGMHVLHRCDNPPCCNPDHLFLGTQKDNCQDMAKKGRSTRKDVCSSGHPRSGRNLYVIKHAGLPDRRYCRTCGNKRNREMRLRIKMRLAERNAK